MSRLARVVELVLIRQLRGIVTRQQYTPVPMHIVCLIVNHIDDDQGPSLLLVVYHHQTLSTATTSVYITYNCSETHTITTNNDNEDYVYLR
jgi:hypothetical protein